jgi:hypothetical protein
MTKEQIKAEQLRLNQTYGFNLKVDGIMGPLTQNAMDKADIMDQQQYLNENYGAGLKVDGILGPLTQAAMDKPIAANETQNKSDRQEAETGQGYSQKQWDAAFNEGMSVLNPSYQEEQQYERAGLESDLAQKQADYNQYQTSQADKFEADKSTLDQNAANNGVLFSGGRAQKQQKLGSSYANADQYKRDSYGRDIGNLARNFQYKYGNDAMGGLSSAYNLGGNTYNPNVARGGVGSQNLSSVYNPSSYNFYGTNNSKQKSEAAQRAYGQLGNVSNKNNPYGYLNKL